jgi:1,5-anhydro-D-fructose reductase (1,5-anhydro-D-mannitol-forming)
MIIKPPRTLIIGYGAIGRRRHDSLIRLFGTQVNESLYILDPWVENRNSISREEADSLQFDVIISAVPHYLTLNFVENFVSKTQIYLLEKPMGVNLSEAKRILELARSSGTELFIGFNYRFMPGVIELMKCYKLGKFGKILRVNMHLGHGGKLDDKESWKLNKDLAGGGVLLDPGIHLLDLFNLLNLKYTNFGLFKSSGFWNTGIEENFILVLEGPEFLATISSSITQWRNDFILQIFGEKGQGAVTGRFGNYGAQKFEFREKWGWKNDNSNDWISEYSTDTSFESEIEHILFNSFGWKRKGFIYVNEPANSSSGYEAMEFYEKILQK